MKRLFTLLLACALLAALAAPALADVAYMPRDNFYEKHMEDCRYENRWYWTNGPEGYVLAHKTPDSKEATPLPNGVRYYVSYLYNDRWGVVEYDKDTLEHSSYGGNASGWVDMSEMVADYDTDAFEADHWTEFNSDAQAELKLEFNDVAYGYKYPGSGIVTKEFKGDIYRDPFLLSPLFTDPAGRTWGFVGYYYGRQNCWICIGDPFNDALAPDENCVTIATVPAAAPVETPAPSPTETPAPSPTETPGKTVVLTPPADKDTLDQAAKNNRGAGPWIAAGAAAVVIVAAAVLVATLRKKKK